MILTKVGNSILKFIEFIKKLLIKQVIMFKKKKHFDTFNYFYSKKSSNRVKYTNKSDTMATDLWEYPCNLPKVFQLLGY